MSSHDGLISDIFGIIEVALEVMKRSSLSKPRHQYSVRHITGDSKDAKERKNIIFKERMLKIASIAVTIGEGADEKRAMSGRSRPKLRLR